MYARYIPPPKPKLPNPNGEFSNQPRFTVQSGATSSTAPVLPKKIVFDDEDFPVPEPKKRKRDGSGEKSKKHRKSDGAEAVEEGQDGIEGTVATPVKKEKKSKRSRQEEAKPETNGSIEADQQNASFAIQDGDAMDVDLSPEDAGPLEDTAAREIQPESVKRKTKIPKGAGVEESEKDVYKRHKSIFDKRDKALKAQVLNAPQDEDDGTGREAAGAEAREPLELHGLEPLPQPQPVPAEEPKLEYDTLPSWLTSPIHVSSETRAAFTDLGIASEVATYLAAQGINDAFAVQTAALPLLLPSTDRQGDVVISAATGSGKTLAYVLPMIRDISQGINTSLRGIIVLPTRDLVDQVRKMCEICAAAFAGGSRKRLIVGEALGKNEFKKEQSKIMETRQRYSPEGYQDYVRSQVHMARLEDDEEEDATYSLRKTIQPRPDHVIEHVPAVDILICTPGRLVEHIKHTPGFTLDYVRWLVVDEADKLLAQDFQQWLSVVSQRLSTGRPGTRGFPQSNKTGIRKVVLSATMTRDLSLLNDLKLSYPKLIVLDAELKLPDLLTESAVRVREPNLKPLYLVALLEKLDAESTGGVASSKPDAGANALSNSEAEDSDSDSSTSDSDLSEDSSSSDSSDSEASSSGTSSSGASRDAKEKKGPTRKRQFKATALIFTRSTESALRLSRLLAILSPTLSHQIGTLTSTTRSAQRERILRSFASGRVRILIASDLVSRGIDLPNLDHVINYDIPLNATSYVHRVGRTARAGKTGHAWTLVSHSEAHTFWTDFGGEAKGSDANKISRSKKVERIRIGDGGEEDFDKERVDAYEIALAQLGKEAGEGRRK